MLYIILGINAISVIRRLSEKKWQTVIEIAKEKAIKDKKHDRKAFILS